MRSRDLYIKIGRDMENARTMTKIAEDLQSKNANKKVIERVMRQQTELYNKTNFKKNYLKARRKIDDRERF